MHLLELEISGLEDSSQTLARSRAGWPHAGKEDPEAPLIAVNGGKVLDHFGFERIGLRRSWASAGFYRSRLEIFLQHLQSRFEIFCEEKIQLRIKGGPLLHLKEQRL